MHQIHLQNVKLKQYIPCKRFVKHLVSAERQWVAGSCLSKDWRARGAAAKRGGGGSSGGAWG